MGSSKTKAVLLFMLALAFGVLLFGGYLMNREKPPIPRASVTADGQVLFTGEDNLHRMGLQSGIVKSDEDGRQVASFFGWLAWAAGTNRPEGTHTYTSNWPYDPLVGNQPLPEALIWSIVSVILLILGIAGAIFLYQRYIREEDYQAQQIALLPEPMPSASQSPRARSSALWHWLASGRTSSSARARCCC